MLIIKLIKLRRLIRKNQKFVKYLKIKWIRINGNLSRGVKSWKINLIRRIEWRIRRKWLNLGVIARTKLIN